MKGCLDGHGVVSVGLNRSDKQFSCRRLQFACSVTPLVDEVIRVLRLSDDPRSDLNRGDRALSPLLSCVDQSKWMKLELSG